MPGWERNGINHCTLETLTTPCQARTLIGSHLQESSSFGNASIQIDPDDNWLLGASLAKAIANDVVMKRCLSLPAHHPLTILTVLPVALLIIISPTPTISKTAPGGRIMMIGAPFDYHIVII